MKILKGIFSQNCNDYEQIKSVINSMKPEIDKCFGPALKREAAVFQEKLSSMTGFIKEQYLEIKSIQ